MVDVSHQWGAAIRLVREAKGMTQKQLAAAIGVTQSAVSQWEGGESSPSVKNQLKIASALGVTARGLFAYPTENVA
jgi:transcriptional regulator with XRE-family HTH domain